MSGTPSINNENGKYQKCEEEEKWKSINVRWYKVTEPIALSVAGKVTHNNNKKKNKNKNNNIWHGKVFSIHTYIYILLYHRDEKGKYWIKHICLLHFYGAVFLPPILICYILIAGYRPPTHPECEYPPLFTELSWQAPEKN